MKGRGARVVRGGARPFIGAGGVPGRRQRVLTYDVKALTPLMAGGLRRRGGGLRGGIKAGEVKVQGGVSMLKPGGAGWLGQKEEAVTWLGLGGTVELMELTCGAPISVVGERGGGSAKRQNSKEKA
jgi:hypothetical protein